MAGPESSPGPRPDSYGLWEQVGTIAVAVLVALLFRQLVLEPFRIPSASMLPTLLVGDHLFVSKLAYGAPVPFSDLHFPAWREPQRGDVIVFAVGSDGHQTLPADRTDLPREDFVKRIVGLPGDRIEFRDGRLYVNGRAPEWRLTDRTVEDDVGRELPVYEVRDGPGRYFVVDDPTKHDEPRAPFVVEEGRYYVMGDNRDNSRDSRFWGTVRREEIQGLAFMLYWSWDYQGGWLALLDPRTWWDAEKRWERVGARL